MSTVFDVLREIERRPGMYLGDSQDGRRRQLEALEMLLHGYSLALHRHEVAEPGRDFLQAFGRYLRDRFGWSMSAGPVTAIRAAGTSNEDAWTLFWKLIADYQSALSAAGE